MRKEAKGPSGITEPIRLSTYMWELIANVKNSWYDSQHLHIFGHLCLATFFCIKGMMTFDRNTFYSLSIHASDVSM